MSRNQIIALVGCGGLLLIVLFWGGCALVVASVANRGQEGSAPTVEETSEEATETVAQRAAEETGATKPTKSRVKTHGGQATTAASSPRSPEPPPPSPAPSPSPPKDSKQSVAAVGQPVTVGDASWTITSAQPRTQLSSRFLGSKQGNFVVVDFSFTNNGTESKTLHSTALKLLDSNQREFDPDTDTFGYISNGQDIFLEQVNPGLTKEGEVIFSVAPDASGFRLQVSDTNWFKTGKAYVDLGF